MFRIFKIVFAYFLFITLIGCSKEPQPISLGQDSCDFCKMMITESKYASELVTDKGKIFKFDSIECLAAYEAKNNPEMGSEFWVPDFNKGTGFINIKDAYFLVNSELKSPMSLNISAFSSQKDLTEIQKKYNGKQLNWKEVVVYVAHEWKL